MSRTLHRDLFLSVMLLAVGLPVRAAVGPASPDFDREIAPLLARRCLDCHSGSAPKGGFDLSRKKSALASIAPGKLADSYLWQRIHDNEMPPKKPLPAAERAVLRAWIVAGARWGADPIDPFRITTAARAGYDWWALQPLAHSSPPVVANAAWAAAPIDRFILARLEAGKLSPSPQADRRTLIRRLSFDLLGLPPTPEAVRAFLDDRAPDAYEQPGGSLSGLARLRRTLGPALAGRGALRRERRLRARPAPVQRLPLSRLGGGSAQSRSPLRRVRPRATGRRRAPAGRSWGPGGHRLSRCWRRTTSSCPRARTCAPRCFRTNWRTSSASSARRFWA